MKKNPLLVFDRKTKKIFEEKIYAGKLLRLLYEHQNPINHSLSTLIAKTPYFSRFYGFLQRRRFSRHKIQNFIKDYGIDAAEFQNKEFTSFNDFFIRKLKVQARPIANSKLIAPADARYLAISQLHNYHGIFIKGKKFSLSKLLNDDPKAYETYKQGSLIIARLAPPDYHRFHFPVDCRPKKALLENRALFSVNPIALRKNIDIITENKRYKIALSTRELGTCLMFCVGATNVGSVNFSYEAELDRKKGDEAGYFAFGGSMLLMLFEKGRVQIAKEILEQSKQGIETYCQMGQTLLEAD